MDYCLYNAIKTPDGTVLWCQTNHDYKSYKDSVSGETYMVDGTGYGTRRSVNTVAPEDLSIWTSDPFEKVRTAKFWASYGKDGKGERVMLSLQEMEKDHIEAILKTQSQLKGTERETLFVQELEYRKAKDLNDKMDTELPLKNIQRKKPKV